jgi:phosphatidylglycerol:prolipoprotein diacylglycerol transferase
MRQVLFEIPGLHLRIFGFGVMLCLAFFAAVSLAAWRAKKSKLDPEILYDLALWILLGGLFGARAFYVWEYWGDRITSVGEVFQIWEGGIVLYGGVMGASLAGLVYWLRRPFPLLPVLDCVAPAIALGLPLGRVGGFLNGCCYGDECQAPWAVSFPPGSPPWWHQAVDAHGLATPHLPGVTQKVVKAVHDGSVPPGTSWSRPVHPTQLYSVIDGLVLLGLLTAFYPLRRRDGEVVALLLVTYPVTRFLIERLRGDEPAFFAGMTVSQNVSIAVLVVGLAFWGYLSTRPVGRYADRKIEELVEATA